MSENSIQPFFKLSWFNRVVVRSLWALGEVGLAKPLIQLVHRYGSSINHRVMPTFFKDFEPTNRDVFVCTYSKSGTNWMIQIALQIAHLGETSYAHIHHLVPWPEAPTTIAAKITDPPEQAGGAFRVIKTHLEAPYVPVNEQGRYLVIIRDPKDVLVSAYHFLNGVYGSFMNASFTVEEVLDLFTSGRFHLGEWASHTASWWALRERTNVNVRTFRSMKSNHAGAVDEVIDFLDATLTPEQRQAVIDHSTFAYMKSRESCFTPPVPVLRDKPATMMRKGAATGGKEALTTSQRKRIDQFCLDALAKLGSDFPYAEVFPLA